MSNRVKRDIEQIISDYIRFEINIIDAKKHLRQLIEYQRDVLAKELSDADLPEEFIVSYIGKLYRITLDVDDGIYHRINSVDAYYTIED